MKIIINCTKCGERLYDKFGAESCVLAFSDYILQMECCACGYVADVKISIRIGCTKKHDCTDQYGHGGCLPNCAKREN